MVNADADRLALAVALDALQAQTRELGPSWVALPACP